MKDLVTTVHNLPLARNKDVFAFGKKNPFRFAGPAGKTEKLQVNRGRRGCPGGGTFCACGCTGFTMGLGISTYVWKILRPLPEYFVSSVLLSQSRRSRGSSERASVADFLPEPFFARVVEWTPSSVG